VLLFCFVSFKNSSFPLHISYALEELASVDLSLIPNARICSTRLKRPDDWHCGEYGQSGAYLYYCPGPDASANISSPTTMISYHIHQGGIFFALVFRFQPLPHGKAIWICGVVCAVRYIWQYGLNFSPLGCV